MRSGVTVYSAPPAASGALCRGAALCPKHYRVMAAAVASLGSDVDATLNPQIAGLSVAKTMAITDLAKNMREEGKDVIGLAAGEPDFDTPEPIVKAGIEAIKKGYTHYTPNVGTMDLRIAISQKLNYENGLRYWPQEIVVSNGAKQSIWQAILAVVSPGDEVLVPAPYWTSYPSMVSMAGARPVVIQTEASKGFLMEASQLEAAITPASRLLILCSPSNPTGCVYPEDRLRAIADVVRKHPRLLVISDEIYEHIIYKPARHTSFASLPDMWLRTMTVNGFSKAFAMTGWRLGYMAAPGHFADAAAVIQSQSTSGACSISQEAGKAALRMGDRGGAPVAKMVQAFQERRDYIVERVRRIPNIRLATPDGAFYIMPDVSAYFGPSVRVKGYGPIPDGDALCRYLIEKALVAVVPGDAFGAPKCLRISYAASLETIKQALDRIEAALQPDNFER